MDTWIQTYSGKRFDFMDPDPESIDIEDIAQALSMQCRYNGHIRSFYSVAEHSVHVAALMSNPFERFPALLHDAAEAYIGDMVSPLKRMMPEYKEIERRVESAIRRRFNLIPMPEEVKLRDLQMLIVEKHALHLHPALHEWECERTHGHDLPKVHFRCWEPYHAKRAFLDAFHTHRTVYNS